MSKARKVLFLVLIIALAALLVVGCGAPQNAEKGQKETDQIAEKSQEPAKPAAEEAWEPDSTIEIIAPAGPGGGWDMLARMMKTTLSKDNIVDQPIIVTNKPGGGGATGWTYLNTHKGNGHYLAVNSSLILLNNLLGRSELSFEDFTPIANLEAEWEVVVVADNSPYKTGKDLFDAIKANPGDITIGVGPSLGNDDHIQFLMLAKAYGIDPGKLNFVVYPGAGGEQIPALLGGHVDALTIGLGEVLEQHKAGKMRIVGISSDKRLDFLPNVPTWKEQGIDLVFAHWRGVMGPKGMSDEQVKYWKNAVTQMVEKQSWKDNLAKLGQDPFYMNAEEYKNFLAEQNAEIKDLLTKVGLIK